MNTNLIKIDPKAEAIIKKHTSSFPVSIIDIHKDYSPLFRMAPVVPTDANTRKMEQRLGIPIAV